MLPNTFVQYQPPSHPRGPAAAEPEEQGSLRPIIPQAVGVALGFIQMSCQAKGPRGFKKCEEFDEYDEVIHVDLLAKHEAAFNQACNLMGVYFDAASEQINRERDLKEAQFLSEHGEALGNLIAAIKSGPQNNDMVSSSGDGESENADSGGGDVHGY